MTATSTVAIDHEVGDQRQRVALLRGRKDGEIGLRGLRILVRPGQRVLGAAVVHDAPPDLVDLLGVEGGALEEALDARRVGRRRPGQHGDERQRPLPFPQVGPEDRKSTRLNSSHLVISYAVFCLKKKKKKKNI